MKRGIVFIMLILLALPLISAVDIKLSKETYSPGETLQAEIYGNFIEPLHLENVYFYRERNIPVVYDILKTKDKYLLYALLPLKEGNYTLKLRNVRYETDTGVSYEDIIKKFKIQKGNETILTINPGFIVARGDFYVTVKSNQNTEVEAEFEATGEKQTLSIFEGKEKKVYFSIKDIENYTETKIKIGNYIIPVFIFPKKEDINETQRFRFNPLEISAKILKEESYFFEVSLINFGDKDIENIEFFSNFSNFSIEIEPSAISQLKAGEKETINLTLSSKEEGKFLGYILAVSQNTTAELKINISVIENKSEINYSGPSYIEKNCSEIGQICNLTEKCDMPLIFTEEGYCCPGKCISEKKESKRWIYGVIIIIVVIVGLIALSFYAKKKKSVDILKEREERYKERMTGGEVRGKLTRA